MFDIGDVVYNWKILEVRKIPKRGIVYDIECINCGFIRKAVSTNRIRLTRNCKFHNRSTSIVSSTKLRRIFKGIKIRCYDSENKAYKWYGGKGIKICDEWLEDSNNFINWSLENGYKEGLTIDRIDSSKDYCPENCRWISRKENAKWKSSTNHYTVNNITDSGKGWARQLGLGINFINKYARKHGKEETLKFIENKLNNMRT